MKKSIFGKPSIIFTVIGVVSFIVFMLWSPAYAGTAEAIMIWSIFNGIMFIFDKFGLKTLNFEEELKNGNTAIGLFYGCLAISFAIIVYATVAGSGVLKFLEQ